MNSQSTDGSSAGAALSSLWWRVPLAFGLILLVTSGLCWTISWFYPDRLYSIHVFATVGGLTLIFSLVCFGLAAVFRWLKR